MADTVAILVFVVGIRGTQRHYLGKNIDCFFPRSFIKDICVYLHLSVQFLKQLNSKSLAETFRKQITFHPNNKHELPVSAFRESVAGLNLSTQTKTADQFCELRLQFSFGIIGVPLDWFTSYLTTRRQRVSISGTLSESLVFDWGVPQGLVSVLLLYII